MELAIKVGSKSITDAVAMKYGVSGDEAIERFKLKLINRRLAKTYAQAEAKYERLEKAQWQDGDVVGEFSDQQKWGKQEIRHFLFVKMPGLPNGKFCGPIREKVPVRENRQGEILRRATYSFPYWDYLDAEAIVKVRDRDSTYQPLLHIIITIDDLVKVSG